MRDTDGRVQTSPPKNLKTLYDFLPSERDAVQKQTPMKVVLKSTINELKVQGHCLGVYTLVHGQLRNERPMWKHSTEDLMLCLSKGGSEEVWVIAHSKTLDTKERVCMKVATEAERNLPFSNSVRWLEWTGRDWQPAPSVTARPSHHGWGADGGDGWQFHQEKSYHTQQFESHRK